MKSVVGKVKVKIKFHEHNLIKGQGQIKFYEHNLSKGQGQDKVY